MRDADVEVGRVVLGVLLEQLPVGAAGLVDPATEFGLYTANEGSLDLDELGPGRAHTHTRFKCLSQADPADSCFLLGSNKCRIVNHLVLSISSVAPAP
jgi:hypothetical protein